MRVILLAVVLTACGTGTTVDNSGFYLTTHVSPTTGGSLVVTPDKDSYDDGETVEVTATAADGFSFVRFSGGAVSTEDAITVTMAHDVELTATFSGDEVTLSHSVTPESGGTISVSPSKTSYHVGDTVKLTAKAAAGYALSGWSGDVTSSATTVSITLDGDVSVEATFTRDVASATLEIVNDLTGSTDGDDDWSQMNTVVRLRAGSTIEGVRDAGEGELLTDGTSSCAPGSIAVGTTRSFEVGTVAPDYFIYVQTGAWEYDPYFSGCWDLYLTQIYDCGGNCCTDKSSTLQVSGHASGKKTIRLSTLLPAKTWEGSALCQ